MADLVRVRLDGVEKSVGAAFAKAKKLTVLDESAHNPDGTVRATTREGGRRMKKKTTVKKAAESKAAVSESAPTTEEKS